MALLLAQLLLVTLSARLAGAAARRLGQPAVVGEIAAGIALGPSLLGALFPGFAGMIFPAASLPTLQLLSQVGIVIFMFLMGLELDPDNLRRQARTAVVVSQVGIIVPFLLGLATARALHPGFAPEGVAFSAFALFLGVAMSITAFPVLARILEERGLSKTPLGSMALACAAVDDATAWSLLAVVTAIVQSTSLVGALKTVLLAVGFVVVMLTVVRPRLSARFAARSESPEDILTLTLLAFACALFTEFIGIHALFGAFVAGIAAPASPRLREAAREKLGSFASMLLVPLFFAFTGLRARLDLMGDPGAWMAFALVMLAAVAGKLGGGCAAARLTGMSWHDSLALGTLMNTRGLMELIVLNIGYDLGILSARMFAVMVLMALTTTLMTGPALSLLGRLFEDRKFATVRP